ncbi:MAG TPA: PfkB family carbohydrate kinase [Candidatus Acidoferrum sp.]|nr:PfkB family carbohydrate kinase [Candidatus Acidoferrum sp.]
MRAAPASLDVLGLGAVAVDDLIYVDVYPGPDAKARVLRQERHCGGLAGTALVAAARLGARCAYAGLMGTDELSAFALACLEREGIDVSAVERRQLAGPGHSHIVVGQQHGTRNIFSYEPRLCGASPRTPAALIRCCRVLLVDHLGVPGMIRAARIARRAGIAVVSDVESDRHPETRQLLDLVDHLIVSQEFAARLTGAASAQEAVRKLMRPDREVAAVTCGAKGCWFLARGWSAPRRQPAFRVEVMDTTGCGDVFHGAYAFGLVKGMPVEERMRLASATAALKATRPGGQAGIPSLSRVRRFLSLSVSPRACRAGDRQRC